MTRPLAHLTFFLSLAFQTLSGIEGKVFQHASELEPNPKFDFIVVGSGPGGATVANRLTANPKFKVLLIEAGRNNEGIDALRIPAFNSVVPSTFTWNYTTTPTSATNNRSLDYSRGYVLGGSSSINGMIYSRGAADDYNSYAATTGDAGWSWTAMTQYFRKHERLVPPAGGRNTSGQYDPRIHSTKGTVLVTLPTFGPNDFDTRALNVTTQQPEFPFLLDMNDGHANGLAFLQSTIGNGERSSAATAYLDSTVRNRPNLSILLNTYVTKVIPTGRKASGGLSLRTVQIGDKASRTVLGNLTATKEVILSAGVIGTPQILLNSGIGSKPELEALGVQPIHELLDVGKSMSDHVASMVPWVAAVQDSVIDQAAALAEWTQDKTGPLTNTPFNRLILWTKIPSISSLWQQYPKPAGSQRPHFEVYIGTVDVEGARLAGGMPVFFSPTSRGSVALRSSDPFDDPVIDAGILQTAFDVAAFKEAYRLVKRFFSGPQWANYLLVPLFSDPDLVSDAEWERALRDSASVNLHGVGTAAMSKRGAKGGVADPDLRVKGVSGLRIVDASVIPYVPAAHTQVPVYVFAERAADLIKASWVT